MYPFRDGWRGDTINALVHTEQGVERGHLSAEALQAHVRYTDRLAIGTYGVSRGYGLLRFSAEDEEILERIVRKPVSRRAFKQRGLRERITSLNAELIPSGLCVWQPHRKGVSSTVSLGAYPGGIVEVVEPRAEDGPPEEVAPDPLLSGARQPEQYHINLLDMAYDNWFSTDFVHDDGRPMQVPNRRDPSGEEYVIQESKRAYVQRAISSLDAQSRVALYGRFGFFGDELTLESTADLLGVSRERVRQLQNRTVEDLRSRLGRVDRAALSR